jgi:hypothetical protein
MRRLIRCVIHPASVRHFDDLVITSIPEESTPATALSFCQGHMGSQYTSIR